MARSEIIECKLPKGRKWSDPEVIKENSPYGEKYGGTNYNQYGKYCYFYPIGNDLYIKGMFSYQHRGKYRYNDYGHYRDYYVEDWFFDKNVIVKLTNYKNLTALEADEVIGECVVAQSMIHTVWNKLGLRQGYMEPMLKDLN